MSSKYVSTRIISCSPENPDQNVIAQAGKIIKEGGLVVYPTDTFYGLGGDPRNAKTVQKIFQVKGRSRGKPLPLILYHRNVLEDWTSEIPPLAIRLMDHFWPGRLTILFPCSPNLSSLLTAGSDKIGLRWPKASIATALARETGNAIISTSANLSGKGGILHSDDVLKDLGGLVDLIIDSGKLKPSLGSTIVDATGNNINIIREGDIAKDKLLEFESNRKTE